MELFQVFQGRHLEQENPSLELGLKCENGRKHWGIRDDDRLARIGLKDGSQLATTASKPTKLVSMKTFPIAPRLIAVAALPALITAPVQIVAEDAPSRVHALVAATFANEYVTPRGMLVRDKGLTAQPLFLTFVNLYKDESWITDITLVGGVWNDLGTTSVSVHGPFGSKPKTPWTEIDPIAGLSFGLGHQFKLDVTYTAFAEQILDIGTSHHLETKLSFDDTPYLKAYALHPYVSFWQELDGKATDAALPGGVIGLKPVNPGAKHPAPGSSSYLDIGIAPGYVFQDFGGLKIEAPSRVLLPDERFYGDFYAKSSTVGLYEFGLKATLPVDFVPAGYGHWSVNLGVKYINFTDDNLYNLNTFNAPGKPTRDTVQVYAGFSAFF